MFRTVSVWSLWLGASAFVLFGAASYLAPAWASENFPWKVGPFLAMTIGGWSLGMAAIAWDASRDLRASRAFPLIVLLGSFALGELVVVALFADRLRLTAPLTIPYLIGLVALLVAVAAWVANWLARRPALRGTPGPISPWFRVALVAFVSGVTVFSGGNWLSGSDGPVSRGDFFPEAMGLFSIRAFAAFFLALMLAALSLVAARAMPPYRRLMRAGLYLIVPITLAAFVNIALFDFTGRPGTLLYLSAYVLVGIVVTIYHFGNLDGEPADEPNASAAAME